MSGGAEGWGQMAEGGRQKAGGVPEGWRAVKLGDCIEGKPAYGANAPSVPYSKDLPRYIRITDINDFEGLNENPVSITEESSRGYILKEGDFLVARSGNTVGKSLLYEPEYGRCAYAGYLLKINANQTLSVQYLKQYFTSPTYWEWVKSCIKAGAQPNINAQEYSSLPILLPPLPEQRKIAAILSTWDDSLATLTRLIVAKQQQKRGLAEALLTGKKRLPGFEREWEEVELSRVMRESRIPAEDELGKRLTVSLHLKGVSVREERDNSEAGKTVYYRRKAGQFIYGKQNIFRGSLGIVPDELDGYLSSQDLPAFDVAADFDSRFLYEYFARPDFYEGLEKISTGTGSKRVHPEKLYKLKIMFPPLPEQRAIASILSTLDGEITSLTQLRAALERQKRGLMDKLLTGQVRVTPDAAQAG